MLLCPNAVVNIPNEMARKRKLFNFGTLKRLALPLNVGKRADGKTFIGAVNDSGNHWVLVIVELRPFKRIIYCDTLAWDPPANIVDLVNNFTPYMPRVGNYDDGHLSIAHSPMATSQLGHMCDWRCRNYPLQTCSDICGVIVLINTALAALNRSFFQYLIGPYEKEKIYLHQPTRHCNYLRRVLMSWFAEGRIDVDYILPQTDWRQDNVPTMSDHSFCLRQDTTINSKKRLKLSLNHLAPSSHGLTPEVSKDHSSAKECSPKFSAASNNNVQTDARSPYPPTSPNPSVRPGPGKSCATAKSQSKTPSLSASTTNKGCSPPKQQSNTPILSASTNNDFTEQPSTNTKPPKSDVRKPTSPQAKSLPESGPVDKAPSRFQCGDCGLQLSSRNCLYKHKKRKHASSHAVNKAMRSKRVVCPECKENESR